MRNAGRVSAVLVVGLLGSAQACVVVVDDNPRVDGGSDATVDGADAAGDVVNSPDVLTDAAKLPDADAGQEIATFFVTAVGAYCQRLATCCNLTPAQFDLNHCTSAVFAGGLAGAVRGLVELPDQTKLLYNATAAQSCLTKLEKLTCTSVPAAEWADVFNTTCSKAVSGTVATGGTCRQSIECVAGQFCEPIGDAGTGTCKPLRTVGAVCGDLGVTKDGYANLTAHESCSTRALGPGFCDDTADPVTPANTWKCGAGAATGASCYYDYQCTSLTCGGTTEPGLCGSPKDLSVACTGFKKPDAGP